MRLECVEPLPFPEHLDIELTNNCNLQCLMCPRKDHMTRERGFMSLRTFTQILHDAKGKAKTCYLHQMGEPLLHPQFDEFIKLAKEAGLWTSLSTNATLLNASRARRLLASNIDHVVVALDSPVKETYERIRVGANYDEVLENVLTFLAMRHQHTGSTLIDIQMVTMGVNSAEVEEFKKSFEPLVEGIGRVMLSPVVDWASTVKVDGVDKSVPFVCTMLNYSMTIQWNGNVCVCCRDFNGSTSMGNVHVQTLPSIWEGSRYRAWRDAFKSHDLENIPPFCRGCFQ